MPDAFQFGHFGAVVERLAFFGLRLFSGHEISLDREGTHKKAEIWKAERGGIRKTETGVGVTSTALD
jgi:hypothetical protein